MSEMNYPEKEKEIINGNTENDDVLEFSAENHEGGEIDENIEVDTMMTEEEFKEQYQKLPMWQHVVLVILFLFGLTAAIMVIDFVVELITELMKHIF